MNDENQPKVRFKGFTDPWEQRKLGKYFLERNTRAAIGNLISVTINDGVVEAKSIKRKDNSSRDKSNYKQVKINDIAYNSMRMWQGASGVSQFDGILSPAYTVLIPQVNVDSRFFGYSFKRRKQLNVFQKYSQGLTSDTWNLKYPQLKQIDFFAPSVSEQKKISELLNSFDHLIAANQDKLDQLKEVKKLLMLKIFDQQWRFSGFTDPWEQRKLSEVTVRVKSYSLSRSNETYEQTGTKYIHYGDIHTGVAQDVRDENKLPNIIPGDYEQLQQFDIIVADASEDYEGIAEPAIITTNPINRIVSGLHTIALRPDKTDGRYIYYLLKSRKFKHYGYKVGTGMKVFGITFSNLGRFAFFLPDYTEQKGISKILLNLENLIAANQDKVDQLKEMKKWLMQNMFV
ncbi:restriction endonuclease subunit S [Secundilactobacillus malefermentans]|uniref:restriction endonuclease subunit S n=1 Tax=Secundilactobacillus malefermentans TaxID=176292 RepID=UPI0011CA4801|nr:restriction endonuclease subunit S [Secundilactobacillus malefermentans]QEA31389.1 hypothetical protein FGL90_03915 [Secundilactobacillus malefermentans]